MHHNASVSAAADGDDMQALLCPTAVGDDRFRALQGVRDSGRVFGGRLVSEALLSAAQTVDPAFRPHSLHAQFLRPCDGDRETIYQVERVRDGRNFCNRAIRIQQGADVNALVMLSFAADPPGVERQAPMPAVPAPDTLVDERILRKSLVKNDKILADFFWKRDHPVEFRPVDLPVSQMDREGKLTTWFRAKPQFLSLDTLVARAALLAYASDRFVMTSAVLPHLSLLSTRDISIASLDHSLWIHRDFAPAEWLLYVVESVTSAGSRSFVRGQMFAENGDHIASVGQEGLLAIRLRSSSPEN